MTPPTFLLLTGMPGVGKLTIAKNIADHYPHFALVHNHLSLDVANQVFTFSTPQQAKLHNEIRSLILQHLREAGKSIIYTTCYTHAKQKENIQHILDQCQQHRYVLKCIHLSADLEVMKQRIVGESRRDYGKLQDFEGLQTFVSKAPEVCQPIDWIESEEIETSGLSVEEVVEEVVEIVEK